MSMSRLSSVPAIWLALTVSALTGPVMAQEFRYEYAVKIICGFPDRPALAPGRYYTAINVHNPSREGVPFRRKFALTAPGEAPGTIYPFTAHKLGPDQALEFDCDGLFRRVRIRFAKGFAVIQSPVELDVVAVYTASGVADSVRTMHVERVPFRPMGEVRPQ